jgi:hypothetical protein
MRAMIVVGVLGLVVGAIWLSQAHDELETLKAAHPAAPAAPAGTLSPGQVHDCRDTCEQGAVLGQWPDERLRACRADCDGKSASRPYEPIRRITVAPADHRPTAPAPVRPR